MSCVCSGRGGGRQLLQGSANVGHWRLLADAAGRCTSLAGAENRGSSLVSLVSKSSISMIWFLLHMGCSSRRPRSIGTIPVVLPTNTCPGVHGSLQADSMTSWRCHPRRSLQDLTRLVISHFVHECGLLLSATIDNECGWAASPKQVQIPYHKAAYHYARAIAFWALSSKGDNVTLVSQGDAEAKRARTAAQLAIGDDGSTSPPSFR